MKNLIYLLFFCTTVLTAQTKYEQGMHKALDLFEEGKLDDASNLFERIAAAEKDKWLPAYYVAQIAIVKNWKDFDHREEVTLKLNSDKAQEYINAIRTINPKTPYADYLQAQVYTIWVAHDGTKYGMKYAGQIGTFYQKIVTQEPDNPMFIASKAAWDIGSAQYFDTPVAPYCAELQRAIKLFATFKPATAFHPKGSLKKAKEAAKDCK